VVAYPPARPGRAHVRLYLPTLVYGGVFVGVRPYYDYPRPYVRDRLTWMDGQTLQRADGWTEFTLDCNARGSKLWFEVRDGRARLDWAEVVFEDGEAQVVDFAERNVGPGVYPLLDFRAGRRVDQVRIVAESVSPRVRLILRMEL